MRAYEFLEREKDINFLKFMIDKAWHLIKKEAARQKETDLNKQAIARQKQKNKKLKSRMSTRDYDVNNFAVRPRRIDKPKLYP